MSEKLKQSYLWWEEEEKEEERHRDAVARAQASFNFVVKNEMLVFALTGFLVSYLSINGWELMTGNEFYGPGELDEMIFEFGSAAAGGLIGMIFGFAKGFGVYYNQYGLSIDRASISGY